MNTNNIDLSKPDAAAEQLAPTLEAGYKTFSAASWALRLWKWVVRPVWRIALGTLRGMWWMLTTIGRFQPKTENVVVGHDEYGDPLYRAVKRR